MRKSVLLVALLTLVGAAEARAQIAIVALGDLGYSVVDPQDWLGNGVFNATKVTYAGSAGVLFGRREGRSGLQVGLEGGLHRILTYDTRINGQTVRGDATAFRALGYVRFWMGENHSWFGEFGVGAHLFDGFSDPSFSPAVGTVLGDGALQFPVKVRGSLLFDPEGMVFPVVLQAGIQLQVAN